MRSKISSIIHLAATAFIIIIVILSCSSEQKKDQNKSEGTTSDSLQKAADDSLTQSQGGHWTDVVMEAPGYEGWREYIDGFLVVYCPPDSDLVERTPKIAEAIKRVFIENAVRLQLQVPMPAIFYLYHNAGEISERTDCNYTCVLGNVFHYMIYTPLGEPIMVRYLMDFDPEGTPCPFCYEGLVTYLNYSGKNYVEEAAIDLYNEKLPPIKDLLDKDRYMALDSTLRTTAAASLVELLLAHPYTPQKFLEFYKSDEKTVDALASQYNMDPKALEKAWHEYLKLKGGFNLE